MNIVGLNARVSYCYFDRRQCICNELLVQRSNAFVIARRPRHNQLLSREIRYLNYARSTGPGYQKLADFFVKGVEKSTS